MILYLVTIFLIILLALRWRYSKRSIPKPDLPPPLTNCKNGKVSGSWNFSSNENRIFASFKGIPYAKPPVGKLRLMRPEPAEDWEGVKQCTKATEFIQRNIFRQGSPRSGKEDALILNVYTPNLKGNLPVMVFIHGGGFISGSSTSLVYGAEFFMNKDVVLVTINYRISVLGGLFLDGDKVPGNQGMRDQVLALRWVQDNIANFGGNKDQVTLFGESAGAMSVMNHVLSPMSKGLFSAAIAQSGSPLSPYTCLNKHPAHYGYKLIQHLGIDPTAPIETILSKLQGMDALELQDLAFLFEEFVRAPFPFKPIVDGGLVEDPFLPEEPIELIRKGKFNKVPLIMGANGNEGLLIKAFYERNKKNYETAWTNFDKIGPLAFFAKEQDEVTTEESGLCLEYVKNKFGEVKFSPTGPGSDKLVEMYGDLLFVAPCDLASRLMSESMDQPVYMYSYTYPGTMTLYDIVAFPGWRIGLRYLALTLGFDLFKTREGVCHADELFLLFKANVMPFNYVRSKTEAKVQSNLIDMWTDFAATRDPTPRTGLWKPFNITAPQYLDIGSCPEMKYPSEFEARMAEWRKIWETVPSTARIMSSPTWLKYPHTRYPIPE